jgi:hypothetical protein
VNCAVCKRDTSPITVTGRDYCSVCGTPYKNAPAPAPTGHNTLDLSAKKTPSAAASVHNRVHSKHVVDLRTAPPAPRAEAPTAPTAKVVVKSHHPIEHPSAGSDRRHTSDYNSRITQAKQIGRSQNISRFSDGPAASPKGVPVKAAPALAPAKPPAPELPSHTVTQHQALADLAKTAPPPPEPPAKPPTKFKPIYRPNLRLSPQAGRIVTTAAAIALMAGYIWLHNYPKLALQNADNQAGIAATMPSYLPSSYSLAHTNTQPGLITLSFHSPSSAQALTIAQQRSSWDSSSLIDDYLGQTTDDYAAVQGQGLTIYLYGNNDATWVNHGIWYSIAGASRLSRAEILKIAYSL